MSTTTLVYQPVPANSQDQSFVEAIRRVTEDSIHLDLVSPYLSVNVLADLIGGRGFRLVTDLSECLKGGASRELLDFLEAHHEHVRDMDGVHAKVVLGESRALVGSANLTTNGICRRFEMGCLLEEEAPLEELRGWFGELWAHAAPVDLSKVEACRATVREDAGRDRDDGEGTLPHTGSLAGLRDRPVGEQSIGDDVEELAKQLAQLTKTREDADIALKLLQEALTLIGRSVDDEFLHLNFGRSPVAITLGQRYVVWLAKKQGRPELGLLLKDFEVARDPVYAAKARHNAFSSGGSPDVPSFYWPLDDIRNLPEEVKKSWRDGIRDEAEKSGRSGFLRHKRPSLYHMLTNDELRTQVLNRAFPSE